MPHAYDNSDLQGDEEVRCIGCCTGCALPGHRCCDVQARLDGLHQAVYMYEERNRLLDAINEAEAHARARMLQLRGRVMNNDFDIDPALHHVHLLLRVVPVCSPFTPEPEVRLHLIFYGGRHVVGCF